MHVNGLIEATQSPEYAAFLLAPQVQPGQGGWSHISSLTDLAPAMDLTLQVIEQLEQQYSIDSSRRSVTGLSMGGFDAWDVAAKRPGFFQQLPRCREVAILGKRPFYVMCLSGIFMVTSTPLYRLSILAK